MDHFIAAWLLLTVLSLGYVVWHNVMYNPVSWVQKLGWVLVTAYTGVVGLLFYLITCRQKKGKSHDASTMQLWQQAANSEVHCVAGDATGIIIAAAIVYPLGLPNGIDLIIEYLAAFLVGLFLFQALMMLDMYEGNYLLAVKKTFFVETVSMNFIMAGMFPVMVFLMHLMPGGDNPLSPAFWFIMGMATIVGAILAYPVNYWFVAKGLKHGCMTVGKEAKHQMGGGHHHHRMTLLSFRLKLIWIVATFALLVAAVTAASFIAPVTFSFSP